MRRYKHHGELDLSPVRVKRSVRSSGHYHGILTRRLKRSAVDVRSATRSRASNRVTSPMPLPRRLRWTR